MVPKFPSSLVSIFLYCEDKAHKTSHAFQKMQEFHQSQEYNRTCLFKLHLFFPHTNSCIYKPNEVSTTLTPSSMIHKRGNYSNMQRCCTLKAPVTHTTVQYSTNSLQCAAQTKRADSLIDQDIHMENKSSAHMDTSRDTYSIIQDKHYHAGTQPMSAPKRVGKRKEQNAHSFSTELTSATQSCNSPKFDIC